MFTICEGGSFCTTEQREERSVRQGGKGRTVASHPQLLIIYTAKTGGGNGLGTRLLIVLSNLYCASRTRTVHFFSGSVRVNGDLVVIIHFCGYVLFPVLCNVDLYSGTHSKKINFFIACLDANSMHAK